MPKSSPSKKSPKASSKKSPKGSSKKSPKKGSPSKKGSPGKKNVSAEPPIDIAIQTDETAVCYLCLRSFGDSAAVQAHLLLMDHMDPFDAKDQQCRGCKTIVSIKDVEQHKCSVMKANFIRLLSSGVVLKYGPPYRCLFCRNNSYGSRVGLAMHLLCHHQPGKTTGRCGMCAFTYDEPPPLPPPNVPALPANADEEKKKQHELDVKAAKEKQLCEMDVATPGMANLTMHISNEHVPAYTLWVRGIALEHTGTRFPYTCPICRHSMVSNDEFHAHVIAAHGNKTQIENDLKKCAICGFAAANDAGLNQHIMMMHTRPLRVLANMWMRHELLMNVTGPGETCIFCWETFRHDFELQAHLLVAHVTKDALRCGWCKVDFTSCVDPILAFMIMQHHEKNHSLSLHQVALKNGYTFVPLTEPLPEVPDKEALIDARLTAAGMRSASPKGKKASPKKSPKKSPKSKSPKSKSPKSKSKSKK